MHRLFALFGLGTPGNPLTASPTQNPLDAFLGWPGNPWALIPWYTRWGLWLLLLLLAWLGWGVARAYQGLWAAWILAKVAHLQQTMRRALVSLSGATGLGFELGSAHWATKREITQAGLLTPGQLPLAQWQGKTLYEPQGGHVLVLGPPRSRKSYGVVMPALRSWPGNVLVSDLRGELYTHTHQEREALGPVFRFDPIGPVSCSLDIMQAVRWGTSSQTADVQRLMHHLLRPRKAEEVSSFQKAAVPLLTAVAIHCHNLGRGSFPDILDWMVAPLRTREDKLREMLVSSVKVVAEAARGVLDESPNLRSVVWNAAIEPLALFQDEVIASRTRTSDLDWQRFLTGLDPTSVYLCTPFADIDRLGPFLGAMVEMLTALLGSPAVTPRHRTLLLLDEMANLGYLDSLERGVSFLQGSGVQVMAIFQNVPQFLTVYGPNSPLLASMATRVLYAPTDVLTAQWVSQELGERTTWGVSVAMGESTSEGQSTSLGLSMSGPQAGMGFSQGTGSTVLFGQTQTRRSLLLPDEVRRIGPGTALVVCQDSAPVWAAKFPGPQTPARRAGLARYLPRRVPLKTLAASVAVGLLAVTLWPLRPFYQQPVATGPLQPWQRDAPPSTAWVRHRLGAPMNLDATVRALQEEARYQRHPRSLDDLRLGRKPASLVEADARQAQQARVPAPAPGPWTLFTSDPLQGRTVTTGHRHFPTQAACTTALHGDYEPLLRMAEQSPPGMHQQVTRAPDKVTWGTHPPGQPPQIRAAWCGETPTAVARP